MKNVKLHPVAKQELKQNISFYESKYKGLGQDFYSEVKSSIQLISSFPELCPERNDETRRYLLNRFPYIIVYLIYNDIIWIVSIAHCKRKPDYWKNRIEK